MMGWQTGDQRQLFYLFNLERRIPASHLLRRINPIVMQVLADLREKLARNGHNTEDTADLASRNTAAAHRVPRAQCELRRGGFGAARLRKAAACSEAAAWRQCAKVRRHARNSFQATACRAQHGRG
jgi:hypothetical protein